MNARAFLVRGLLAGLLAGLATFLVAHQVGEPQVETAIGLEETAAPTSDAHTHTDGDAGHAHGHQEDDGAEVSRGNQRTWGLATGTLTVGLALGGVIALVSAAAAGRMGSLTIGQSTAVVTAVGFVAFALVPFLKYPSTPPAVGSGETIGHRTAVYFGFLVLSLAVAILVCVVAVRVAEHHGAYPAVVGAVAAYVGAMAIAAIGFPTVNEIGEFPADTLWSFRLSSLLILTTMWAMIGVALVGLLRPLAARARADQQRRDLAAAL